MKYFGIALTAARRSIISTLARHVGGAIGLILLSCLCGAPVLASHICVSGPGPGEVQVGMTNMSDGSMVPVCEQRDPAGGSDRPPSSGPPDLSGFINALADYHKILLEEAKRRPDESEDDYAVRLRGSWDFDQPPSPKQGERRCLATFIRPPSLVGRFQVHGIVSLIAPASPTDPALLIFLGGDVQFLGGDVPNPRKNKLVTVKLTQNGDPPQTITAYHFRVDKDKILHGFVFVVPNTAALLGAIEDKYNAQIEFKGKKVFSIDWYDGETAKQFLLHCTSQADRTASMK